MNTNVAVTTITETTPTQTPNLQVDVQPGDDLTAAWERNWARIVAKSWIDPEFKQQLLDSPASVLAREGMPMLPGVDVRIVSGGGGFTMEIQLPEPPRDLDGEHIDDLIEGLSAVGQNPQSSCCC